MNDYEYLVSKRVEVLEAIKPICEVFNITDYDYIISKTGQKETLRIYDTKIGCSSNSIPAVIQELVGYIFILKRRERHLGTFHTQTTNVIKRYWINKEV